MTRHGGGWTAIKYVLDAADRVGWLRMWKAMRTRNACKTCALGMGGQLGGMRNEAGHWPEVCKKSLQAMASDMQDGIRPEFFARYGFAELRTFSPREMEMAGRIVHPLYAGPGDSHYRVLSWDDALRRIADKLKATDPREAFFYMSGRSSNEAAFLLQLFARIYGTNHINNCSYYCHQASGVALSQAVGSSTATVTLEDVENADLFFLIGGNPASNHPRLMRTLMMVRRRGGRVIVVNPVRETGLVNFRVPSDLRSLFFGSEITSTYIQPHIGGDIAFLLGVAKALLERGATDRNFINSATEGWDGYVASVERASWGDIVDQSGVARGEIEAVADQYASAGKVVFGWTMGITHHEHGVDNVRMIVNLALMRGMAGRPGCGLLPIRGHSNVQGIGSVGVTPKLRESIFEGLESRFGVKLPTFPGYDTMRCMDAAERGAIRVAFCLGGNLFGSNPDAAFAHRALGAVDLVVQVNTTLNTGHAWGRGRETIVLPVLARDEEPQSTTQESMFNFVRLSDGGEARHAGPRSEVSVIAALARAVLGDLGAIDWRSMEEHHTIRNWIAEVVPGYQEIAGIDQTRREFHVGGRLLRELKFPTPSGKAQFKAVRIPHGTAGEYPTAGHSPDHQITQSRNDEAVLSAATQRLRLMTIRSEGQFNTVVYEDHDLYRNQDRRDVLLMNPADMGRLGFEENDAVTVRSSAGAMHGILVRAFDIRAGNVAMYYPEANVLVPRSVDPQSGTPAFKNVSITVHRAEVAVVQPDGDIALRLAEPRAKRTLNAC